MTWPSSPINGAQTTINGITYQYDSAKGVWTRLGQVFGNIAATAYTVGNLVVTNTAQLGNLANVTIGGGATGQYITTNGAGGLSWTAVSGGAFISNGTSNVSAVVGGGNVTVSIAGTPNTVVFTSSGVNIAGTINSVGNANVGNIGAVAAVFTGNVNSLNANLGNLATANFYSGSGNLLSNIQGANVSGAVAFATTANAVAGANVSGQVANSLVAGTVYTAAQPAITSVGTLTSLAVTGNITSGNANLGNLITANFHSGSGNLLSNIQGANVSGAVAFATTANAVAGANVSGAVSYASTANAVAGANVSGQVANALVAGTVYTSAQPSITSVGTLTSLAVTGNITSGNANLGNLLIANFHSGSGNMLSNIQGSNVIGAVAFATTANAVAGANVSGAVSYASTANAVAGANVSGQVANALVAGTVFTAAQPSITSVGTLTSLAVTGNITSGNANLGNLLIANFHSGSGNLLSNIQGANVSGAVSFATTANAVAGANVSGQVSNALIASTVYTAAQPNITSVGTLANLTVAGGLVIQQSQEVFTAKTGATGSVTHDYSTGATFYHTGVAANFTAAVTNLPTTASRISIIALVIVQGTTPYVCNGITINGGSALTINWSSGTVPTGAASKTEVMVFTIFNNAGTYTVLGQLSSYG